VKTYWGSRGISASILISAVEGVSGQLDSSAPVWPG